MIQINNDDFYLFQDILKRNYFNFFKKGEKNIEFILNHTCNQNCSNCFGCSYDTEVYKNQNIFIPTKTNKYDNLSNLIKWYIKNNFYCNIFFRGCIEEESFDDLLKILQKLNKNLVVNDFRMVEKTKYIYLIA